MTGLVERLRQKTDCEILAHDLMWEAADEIERLREVVRFYACECFDAEACETFGDHDRSACGYKARKALGEDK